jgi:SAM-dependent methyltransferase
LGSRTVSREASSGTILEMSKLAAADFDLLKGPYYIFNRFLRRAFKSNVSALSGTIVDLGCGMKPYERFVNANECIGIDVSGTSLADIIGDCLNLPFRNGIFCGAICTEVLEHTRNPNACLQEINRVLLSGASLLLSAPMMWGLHAEPHDYFRFTKYSVQMLLEENGFKIERIVRIGGISSVVVQRLIDVIHTLLHRILGFLPVRFRHVVIVCLLAPFQILGYYVSCILDRIDDRDALGWFAASRKL